MKRSLSAIWIFLALSGVGVGCFSVVDNLYFQQKGYSTAVIGGLVAVFNISVAIAEIPAAVVFDRRSHWFAIQLGNLVRTAALILFFLSLGVTGDVVAEALAGVGAAAMSGTSIAYILNRLEGGTTARRQAMARIAWLGSASSLAGGLLGALLFEAAPQTIWLGGALCMMGAGAVFLIGRPRSENVHDVAIEPLRAYARGLGALAAHPGAWMSVFANAALVGPLILWQLRLGAGSLGAVLLGFAVMKAAGVLGGRLIGGRRIHRATLFVLVAVNAGAMFAFAASDTWAVIIAGFGVHVVAHVAISVYCSAQFQEVVPDNRRAGASSVVSLLGSGLTAVAAVAVGVLADRYSSVAAILPSLLLYVLVAGIAMVAGIRSRHPSPRPALEFDNHFQ